MTYEYHSSECLTAALVGERHARLYQTSATFKSQMDMLAAMLPAWADGIAIAAEQIDEQMEQAKQAILAGPMLLNLPTLEGVVR